MNAETKMIFESLFTCYPILESCKIDIEDAFTLLNNCFNAGGKLLLCGNGGSASDCEHIAGELLKGFNKMRRPVHIESIEGRADISAILPLLQGALPAIPLISHSGVLTAIANDTSSDMIYAQQVFALCKKEDIVMGLSTSGNAVNVFNALALANAMGAGTIALTGENGGKCAAVSSVNIKAPEKLTYKIQELHLPIYHALCAMLEAEFFSK